VTELTFRSVSLSDAPTLVEIYNHYIATSTVTFDIDPWTVDDMVHKMETVEALGMPFIVVELSDAVVGYAYLSTWREKSAYATTMENTLYVRDDTRGQGIGGPLLNELLDRGQRAGVREVIAVIANSVDATPSIRLHEKNGFTTVGEMANVGVKFDTRLGVIMMQRSLA